MKNSRKRLLGLSLLFEGMLIATTLIYRWFQGPGIGNGKLGSPL
jgi:hypothetical protein